jgi:CubicO group peptidase (beta-lactamase class C family)
MTRLAPVLLAALLAMPPLSRADDLSSPSSPEELGFSSSRLARLHAWFQTRIDAGDITGAVLVIARGGKLADLDTVGFQDRGKQIPIKRDSIFWIASMTKPVTSVAAMILVEEGKLDLDAPVAQYLPELKDMPVAVERPNPTGTPDIVYEPAKRPMTIRDLFRHTSGLVYPPQYIDSPVHRLYNKAVFRRDRTLADFTASLGKLPLVHQPGEVWEYSWGVDVLARVVEATSGEPFDQFLKSRIFAPLHMDDTGFYVPEDKLGRLVDAMDAPRTRIWDVTTAPRLFSGGGGLVSTGPDYLRFCQMLLNGGELDGVRVLTEKSVAMMTTDSLPAGLRFAGDMIGPDAGSTWGLGFAIRSNPNNSHEPGSVGTYGWSGAWGTYFWIDPAEKLIAIQMIQNAAGTWPYSSAFRRLVYGALRPQATNAPEIDRVALSAQDLAGYAGAYDFGDETSPADRRDFVGATGIAAGAASADGLKVTALVSGGPAAKAGLTPGDIVTAIEGAPAKDLSYDEAAAKLRGPIGSEVHLTVQSKSGETPRDITLVRAFRRLRSVELTLRVEGDRLRVEATGAWPLFEFEKGKSIALSPLANGEFVADSEDHTRIAFERNSEGAICGLIVNPGAWAQRGLKIEP